MNQPLEIFCCAAEVDQTFLDKLYTYFKPQQRRSITLWDKSAIPPGANADEEIRQHLASAHIFLLLISSDFLANNYCYDIVLQAALARYTHGEALILPVITRPASWQNIDILSHIQVLPRNGQPIIKQPNWEIAFGDVVQEIEQIIQRQRELLVKSNLTLENKASGAIAFPQTGNSLKAGVFPGELPSLMEKRPPIDMGKISSPSRNKRNKIGIIFVFLVVLIVIGGTVFAFYTRVISNSRDPSSRTLSTIHPYPSYLPDKGTFSFFDPLSKSDDHWRKDTDNNTNGMCQFTAGTLHVKELSQARTFSCDGPSASDFAFEVQMTIIQGDCGGITFRDDISIHSYYQFDVCLNLHDEESDLFKVDQGNYSDPVRYIHVPSDSPGLNHTITLAMMAKGNQIWLFVNNQQITSYQDSSYTEGRLNLIARDNDSKQTEVAYQNATLWTF